MNVIPIVKAALCNLNKGRRGRWEVRDGTRHGKLLNILWLCSFSLVPAKGAFSEATGAIGEPGFLRRPSSGGASGTERGPPSAETACSHRRPLRVAAGHSSPGFVRRPGAWTSGPSTGGQQGEGRGPVSALQPGWRLLSEARPAACSSGAPHPRPWGGQAPPLRVPSLINSLTGRL